MPQGNKALRPTIIGPTGASLRETTDASTQGEVPASLTPSPVPVAPLVRLPTAIPGVERKRIDVPPGALERLSPSASAEVYVLARALIAAFMVDKATERKAILWSQDLQKAYSDLVTEALALSRSPVLRKAEGYLARTMDILGSIDLLAACGHRFSDIIDRPFQGVNSRVDTPAELASARAELERLVALIAAAREELLDLGDRLLAVVERTEEAGEQLEAAALAALFLSQHLQNEKDAVAQRFAERAMSLTQTLALIREGSATRKIQPSSRPGW